MRRLVLAFALLIPLAAQAQPVPLLEAIPADYHTAPHLDVVCDLSCAMEWTLTASSSLPDQGRNRYPAGNLEDRDLATAWVEGARGQGEGERLTLAFRGPDGDTGASTLITALYLVNGYDKTAALWEANSRVRRLRLALNGRPVALVDLLDQRDWQAVYFDALAIAHGDVLTLEIVSVYPGSRYTDTAISELLLYGGQ